MSNPEFGSGVAYNRAVMLINPVSRYAADIKQQEDHFREQFGPKRFHVIQSPDGRRSSAIDTLGSELEEGDVLLSAGGDGQLNLVVNACDSGQLPDAIAQTPIVPLWNGGACDGANSLNSRDLRNDPVKILNEGRVITSSPLEINIDLPEGRYWRDAALYAGLGVTALFAKRVGERRDDAQQHTRLRNKLEDHKLALTTLRTIQPFTIEQVVNGRKTHHTQIELSAFRGPRMAEVFRPTVKLDDSEWRLARLTDKRPMTLGSTLGRLCIGQDVGQVVKPMQRAAFKVLDRVLMQFDGEYIAVPAFTDIRFISGAHQVRYITTR